MLSENEKKEMLEDALSPQRRAAFLNAEKYRAKSSRDLNDYIAFLMAVQKIKPFKRTGVIPSTSKNIL